MQKLVTSLFFLSATVSLVGCASVGMEVGRLRTPVMSPEEAIKHKGEIKEITWYRTTRKYTYGGQPRIAVDKSNFILKAEHECGKNYSELGSYLAEHAGGVSEGIPLARTETSSGAYIRSKIRCDG